MLINKKLAMILRVFIIYTPIAYVGIPLRPELPRIAANYLFLEIGEFCEILCPFVMFYDSVTTQTRQSYECLANLAGFRLVLEDSFSKARMLEFCGHALCRPENPGKTTNL